MILPNKIFFAALLSCYFPSPSNAPFFAHPSHSNGDTRVVFLGAPARNFVPSSFGPSEIQPILFLFE